MSFQPEQELPASMVPTEVPAGRISIISRLARIYPYTNGLASMAELASGVMTGNVAVGFDGFHGTAEMAFQNQQISDAHNHEAISPRRRTAIYGAISSMALASAGVAIGDAAQFWQTTVHNEVFERVGMGAASISALTAISAAVSLVRRARQKYPKGWWRHGGAHLDPTDRDIIQHIGVVDAPISSAAVASAGIRLVGGWLGMRHGVVVEDIENAIGVVGGLWGSWVFRPTNHNLNRHHDHTSSE